MIKMDKVKKWKEMSILERWKVSYKDRKNYLRSDPHPIYDLILDYLPRLSSAKILDIGCGNAEFEDYLNLLDNYKNFYLLDGSEETIKSLKEKYNNIHSHILLYQAPNNLPFEDESINFIYCSHLIEHLYTKDVYKLFKEIDRVLSRNGILVFRSPLICKKFYMTFTHEKPYNPLIFLSYFCGDLLTNIALPPISVDYNVLEWKYRYDTSYSLDEGLGSPIKIIDFFIQFFKLIKRFLFKTYTRTGYTIIMRKGGV